MTAQPRFPFSAVVGHDDAKLALLLSALDPHIGGVLLRGQKGSAKTTLARGLAGLLAEGAPFAELPLGATEDRVVGTLDFRAALSEGQRRFEPGVLAAADGGVLYVDEVNLLADHLVDVLLDVAVSGVNRVEREGMSHEHPSRFVLVGSMNPEEGDLRPQLLDRFGVAVEITSPADPAERAEAVRRRLAFDVDPDGFLAVWEAEERELGERLATGRMERSAAVPDAVLAAVTRLCGSVGAEGLRADLVTCRAAAALARWEGRDEATLDDVRRVAPLALAHRRRRTPFEEPGIDRDELERAMAEAEATGSDGQAGDRVAEPDEPPGAVTLLQAERAVAGSVGRRSVVEGPRGRLVGDRPPEGSVRSLALGATIRASAARRSEQPDAEPVAATDLREAVREQRAGNLIVLAVDASGSMGAERRMEAAKGAVVGLLLDAYQRRDRVALVAFRGEHAEVVLRPTGSVEVARARLAELPTGGRTPLAAGISEALRVASTAGPQEPLLVLVSDGRATAAGNGDDPVDAALTAATAVRRHRVAAVVIDAENGPTRLGLARDVAEAMGARYLTLPELSAGAVESAVRGLVS